MSERLAFWRAQAWTALFNAYWAVRPLVMRDGKHARKILLVKGACPGCGRELWADRARLCSRGKPSRGLVVHREDLADPSWGYVRTGFRLFMTDGGHVYRLDRRDGDGFFHASLRPALGAPPRRT